MPTIATEDLELDHVDAMLDPDPLWLETGVLHLDSGPLLVATRVAMPGCRGEMLEWWFTFVDKGEFFHMWHPIDHLEFLGWDEARETKQTYIGASSTTRQSLKGEGPSTTTVEFHDPAELFTPGRLAAARAKGAGVICGYVGMGDHPRRDAQGHLLGARLIHAALDNDFGCVLRSRYYLGWGLPPEEVPERSFGLRFLWHSVTEYSYLAKFLPSLYWSTHRGTTPPPIPW